MDEDNMDKLHVGKKLGMAVGIVIGASIVLGILGLLIWRGAWLTYVDNYELPYMFDALEGKIVELDHTGYVKATPLIYKVHTIDLRPMQICISANQRTLNCKLVQFNRKGLQLFLSWHGRGDYDSISTQTGSMRDILMSYAFDGSGRTYSFLTILPSSTDIMGGQSLPQVGNYLSPVVNENTPVEAGNPIEVPQEKSDSSQP